MVNLKRPVLCRKPPGLSEGTAVPSRAVAAKLPDSCPGSLFLNPTPKERPMETFQQIMYGFYTLLTLAAIALGVWFYKKRKESQ